MKVRTNKFDVVFSKLIRLRDGFICQRCKTYYEKGHGLECSHFYSRRHQATRYDPDNACAHCFTCHQYLGENPIEFQAWIRGYLGDVRYSELNFRKSQIMKRTKADKIDLYAHLKSELKKLEQARASGAPLPAVVGFD